MSDTAIILDNVSKHYRLGKIGSGKIHEEISSFLKKGNKKNSEKEIIKSLNNVSFEVKKGDSIGLIGRNGAGKSTLLKILSKITMPTLGAIKGQGRIASLLEVGTGFHPELTGKENIFLNGSILGMKNHEIKSNLDEIIEFSGIGKYIDTPVKRYSSGMYVRLAFSVAAHLNSEILIVDEVLAVGDVDFQKKCLNKMGNIKSKDGRTVIFVSHNMNAISALCNKTVLLEKGELVNYGDTEFVVNQYLNKPLQNEPIKSRKDRTGNGEIQLLEIDFFDIQLQNYISSPISGNNYIIELKIKLNTEILDFSKVEIALGINDVYGNRISLISNKVSGEAIQILEKNSIHIIRISVHKLSLSNGTYSINSFISNNGIINDWLKEAISFTIEKDQFFNQNEYSFNNGMGNFHLNYTYLNNA